jgi:periplasmic protein TonB
MICYNVPENGAPQVVVASRYPRTRGSPRRSGNFVVSLLLHVVVASLVALGLSRRAPTRSEPEQSIEIVYQVPSKPTPEEPQTPSPGAAPAPAEMPPPPLEPQETAPPVPSSLLPPQVEEAFPFPAVPSPVAPLVEPAAEAPKPPPKPSPPPARPQPRPVVRARPAPLPAPSTTPMPAPAPTAAEPPAATVSAAWQQQLAAWLAAHKRYPEEARRRGIQGSVMLRFAVDRSGRVTEVAVVHGSGSPILDAAADAMLRNAVLPPFPETMSQNRIEVSVRVRFGLIE